MCDPVSIGMFSLSALSTAVGYKAQSAQADYQNKMAYAQAENARQATINDYNQSSLRSIEEEDASAQKVRMQIEEMRKAQATARVSAGEAGVSGLSVDTLFRDIEGQGLSNVDVVNQNLAMFQRQNEQNKKAIHTTGKSRGNQAASRLNAGPSALGAALEIGGAGLSAYDSYQKRQEG